jgi:hypothetical protein
LKSLLMLLPKSSSYSILNDRLLTVAKFRQASTFEKKKVQRESNLTPSFSSKFEEVRMMHCNAKWRIVRKESLETSQGNGRFGNDGSSFVSGDVEYSLSRDMGISSSSTVKRDTLTSVGSTKPSQPGRSLSEDQVQSKGINNEREADTETSHSLCRQALSQPGEVVGANKWKEVWSQAKTAH